METRKFASPAVKALMSQRSAEFGGLLLGLLRPGDPGGPGNV